MTELTAHRTWLRWWHIAALIVVASVVVAILVVSGPPSEAEEKTGAKHRGSGSSELPLVWAGSPIGGTWDLPPPQGDGPTVHHWLVEARDQGDFAVDLIADAGKDVILYAAAEDESIPIAGKVDQTGASCSGGGGGSFVTVGLYTGETRIGSATYAHIDLAAGIAEGVELGKPWDVVLGTVGDGYTQDPDCWTGPHVHFQLYSEDNYACFSKDYELGEAISPTNFLGFTGGAMAGEARQPCP